MNTREETARFSFCSLDGRTRANSRRNRERTRRPTLESLESRELLSVTLHAFPNATTSTGNTSITSLGGQLWVAETSGNSAIAEVTTAGTLVKEFALPPRGQAAAPPRPKAIVAVTGTNGTLWFTTYGSGQNATGGLKDGLGAMTTSGQFSFFDVPAADPPSAITIGPDGRPWFLETSDLVRVDPTNQLTVFPLGSERGNTLNNFPGSLTAGPNLPNGDQTLYFTEGHGYNLVQFDVTASVANNASTFKAIPVPDGYSVDRSIVNGGDGTLWFAGGTALGPFSVVGQYDPATGAFSSHIDPSQTYTADAVTVGPDHNIWFVRDPYIIGEYDTTAKVFHAYSGTGLNRPYSITNGPDGNLWFTDRISGALGQVAFSPVASANLSLDPGATVATAPLGKSFSYTVKITNSGTADASNVVLTARLPDGFDYTGPNANGYSFDGAHTVTYTQPTLLAGQAVTASLPGFTSAVGVLGGNSTIFTMSVRSDTTTPTTAQTFPPVTVVQASAALRFVGGAPTTPVHPGGDFSYTIDETNGGPSDDSNLNVVVHLPAGVAYTGPIGESNGVVFAYNSTSTANEVTYTQSSFHVSTTPTRVTIPVHVSDTVDTASPLAADASASSDLNLISQNFNFPAVTVTAAASVDLVLSNPKVSESSAQLGDLLTYSLTIANVGSADATSVLVVTQLPQNLAFAGPTNDPHYRVFNLASGSFVFHDLDVLARSSQPVTETFQARVVTVAGQSANQPIPAMLSHASASQKDRTEANNYALFPSIPVSIPTVAHLGVEIQGPTGTVDTSNQDVAYTVTITNNGPATATGVRFNVVLPPSSGLTYVSSTVPINTPVANLAKGASLTTVIHAITNGGGVNSTATLTVVASSVNSLANVTGSISTPLVQPSVISVQIRADKTAIFVGQTLTYTVTVSNRGRTPLLGVYATGTVPTGMVLLNDKGVPTPKTTKPLSNLGNIAAGKTATYKFKVMATTPAWDDRLPTFQVSGTAGAIATGSPNQPTDFAATQTLTALLGSGYGPAPDVFVASIFQDLLHRFPTQAELWIQSKTLTTLDDEARLRAKGNVSKFATDIGKDQSDLYFEIVHSFKAEIDANTAHGKPPADAKTTLTNAGNARALADLADVKNIKKGITHR